MTGPRQRGIEADAIIFDGQSQVRAVGHLQAQAHARGSRVAFDIAQRFLGHAKDYFSPFIAKARGVAIDEQLDRHAGSDP